jgi:hypothetical protein
MHGAQILRNEAYIRYAAVTKNAAQRSSWGVFATPSKLARQVFLPCQQMPDVLSLRCFFACETVPLPKMIAGGQDLLRRTMSADQQKAPCPA